MSRWPGRWCCTSSRAWCDRPPLRCVTGQRPRPSGPARAARAERLYRRHFGGERSAARRHRRQQRYQQRPRRLGGRQGDVRLIGALTAAGRSPRLWEAARRWLSRAAGAGCRKRPGARLGFGLRLRLGAARGPLSPRRSVPTQDPHKRSPFAASGRGVAAKGDLLRGGPPGTHRRWSIQSHPALRRRDWIDQRLHFRRRGNRRAPAHDQPTRGRDQPPGGRVADDPAILTGKCRHDGSYESRSLGAARLVPTAA